MSYQLVKIGRGKKNDIVLNNPEVSTNHAEIFMNENGQFFITDLDSKNGTYINKEKLSGSQQIYRNDIVQLAGQKIEWISFFNDVKESKQEDSDVIGIDSDMKTPFYKSRYFYIILTLFLAIILLYGLNEYFVNTKSDKSISNVTKKGNDNSSESEEIEIEEETTKDENSSDLEDQTAVSQPPNENTNQSNRSSSEIDYDYSCLGRDLLNDASDLEAEFIKLSGVQVTISEEEEAGRAIYQSALDSGLLVQGPKLDRCRRILNRLVPQIKIPKGYTYKIHVLNDESINAHTFGGYIFVYSGMLDFVRNDSELACVIGHEIAHNERGHISDIIARWKISQEIFGEDLGALVFERGNDFAQPFNQKNETECDYFGVGYAHGAGFEICASVSLWNRMSQLEEYDELSDLLSSHPYSQKRSDCCKKHIQNNYSLNCP